MSLVVKRFGPLNYGRCEMLMLNKAMVKIGPNTTLHKHEEQDKSIVYRVKFYDTFIISFYLDGRIILHTGGYRSTTTKQRMNALVRECSIYQRKYEWRVIRKHIGEYMDEAYFDGINVGIRDPHRNMVHDIHEEG